MALIFMESFDKYGGVNSNATSVAALMAGEWTTANGTIVAPLSATGQAIQIGTTASSTKTLASNYGRIIGGIRFSSNLAGVSGITFQDAGTAQCAIRINTTGTIAMYNGGYSTGTAIATSTATVAASSTHYLEWDITISASGAYNIYLDGVSILSGTANTKTTANNSINGILLGNAASAIYVLDDLYLFDSTGSTNNAPLLNSPRIETTFPASDSAVQFSIGASVLGSTVARGGNATISATGNGWYVRPFTPARACTLSSILVQANATTNGSANYRPVVYIDSSGVPGTLLASGPTVTGITAGAVVTMPLTTPQSLTAGTQYWLGFMADVGNTNYFLLADAAGQGRSATATFSSGAPGTAPASSGGQNTILLWGNITLASAANYYEVSQSPPPAAATSYVYSSTVGQEDLYAFNALSVIPANLYAVSVKAFCQRSDTGARSVSMRVHSGSTDSGGTLTGQTPGTSQAWLASNFETDPNGGIAWTGPNLNAATSGFRIDA